MSDILKQITIPSPCHANWDSMTGDDRTRFCEECGKSVTNLAAMTEAEAASLVEIQGHNLCAQVTRREDGSVVTQKRRTKFGIGSLMINIAWIAGLLSMFRGLAEPGIVTRGRVCVLPAPTPPASDANGNPVDDLDYDVVFH
jgi:hypothetical protein